MRWLIETAAMQRLTAQPGAPWRDKTRDLLERHHALQVDMRHRYGEFPVLDREFHLWIAGHLRNRFAEDFFDIVSLVFHYHYQWNRIDEHERNHVAVGEHIGVLTALAAGELELAQQRLRDHLRTSRESLIRSLQPQ